jgi:hypothetical protein
LPKELKYSRILGAQGSEVNLGGCGCFLQRQASGMLYRIALAAPKTIVMPI